MPDSLFKKAWNSIIIILLLQTALFVPYRTAFIDDGDAGLFYFELTVDMLFIVDVFINFLSAYYDKDSHVETRIGVICKEYMKSWFFIDIVAWYFAF